MDPTEPHFLETISNYRLIPRFHSGGTKVPSPLIKRHCVVTFFHVVRQSKIPPNIQIIPWETKTSDRIPQSDKADLSS